MAEPHSTVNRTTCRRLYPGDAETGRHPADAGRQVWNELPGQCRRHAMWRAMRANPVIRTFHTRLVARGKPRKVALVAAMHKLLTFLNAVMRDQTPWRIPPQVMPGT